MQASHNSHRIMLLMWIMVIPFAISIADEIPPLVTDRPDQTESAVTVPKGFAQFEVGWTHTYIKYGQKIFTAPGTIKYESESDEFPQSLVRYGISDRVELRFGWDGYIRLMTDYQVVDDLSGLGNIEVGAKFVVAPPGPNAERMTVALLTGLTIPAGDDEVAPDNYVLSTMVLLAKKLSERASVGVNLGTVMVAPMNDYGLSIRNTVSLGVSLTDKAGAFIETFGEYRVDTSSETERWQTIDGGLTHAIGDNAQIDVSGGVGITKYAPDWFIGAGAALRVGK